MSNMKKYRFIGHAGTARLIRKGKSYNINTITDDQVAALLKSEPDYWSTHFEKIEKKDTKSDKSEK